VVDCYDTNRLQHASLDPIVKKAAGGKEAPAEETVTTREEKQTEL